MGKFCAVPGCPHRANRDKFDNRGQTIGFFQFPPENDPRRAVWLANIHRDSDANFIVSGTTCICSSHFEEKDIERLAISTGFRLRLVKDAVPSVFDWERLNSNKLSLGDNLDDDDKDDETNDGTEDEEVKKEPAEARLTGNSNAEVALGSREVAERGAGLKRKAPGPPARYAKQAKPAASSNRDMSREQTEAELQRLRATARFFDRKFADMSRLVNDLRSTTIKMLGVMSSGDT